MSINVCVCVCVCMYIYISSCRATSTDIPDPLSPPLPIVHGLWQVFRAISRLVFHASGGISSSPAAFLFLIFLRTESSSSWVNGPILMCWSLCVFMDGWPTKGYYLQHFWLLSECLERPLCLFWHKDHTKGCAWKNLQDQKKRMKDITQSGVRLQSRE